jgi:signal transduction histidine kinase
MVPLVMAIYAYVVLTSFALLAGYDALVDGMSVGDLGRAVWRNQLAVEAPIALLTGLAAHVYGTAGLVGLAVLAAMQLIFLSLARDLRRSNERASALAAQAEQVAELSASRSQLVSQILVAEERERRRLAEALHDDAMQNLLAAGQDLSPALPTPNVERARLAVQATVDQLRDAIFALHPAVLERVGLAAAIEAVAERAARRGRVEVTTEISSQVEGEADVLLFSIARELIANVAAHSRAKRARVRIYELPAEVVIEVADDGCGFLPARIGEALKEGHIGLASTAERIEALGGTFTIDSEPDAGTTAVARIPRGTDGSVGQRAPVDRSDPNAVSGDAVGPYVVD